ncbi:MAG: helix-turn-helix transcriptional regulator [Bacteroidetes bacterium]|nr:helix-turn-helix transcriptional regulator [Bacteroidota bacterium]
MRYTPEKLGKFIRETRKNLDITQRELAMSSGTGIRFITDLEKGKPTCHIGKVLTVMNMLGIDTTLTVPKNN